MVPHHRLNTISRHDRTTTASGDKETWQNNYNQWCHKEQSVKASWHHRLNAISRHDRTTTASGAKETWQNNYNQWCHKEPSVTETWQNKPNHSQSSWQNKHNQGWLPQKQDKTIIISGLFVLIYIALVVCAFNPVINIPAAGCRGRRNQGLLHWKPRVSTCSPFHAWGRSEYGHGCLLYCQGLFPVYFLPPLSIHLHLFRNLSLVFLCVSGG